jgi:hypothetical protein
MKMNRRKMLGTALASLAVTASGCKTVVTHVVFINKSGAQLDQVYVKDTKTGATFNKSKIKNGATVKEVFTKGDRGADPVTGYVVVGGTKHNLGAGGVVYIGETNTYTAYADHVDLYLGNIFIGSIPIM